MGSPVETRAPSDLRDTLAAERTFLAWIRTGLALMGFGFVVARFGLFLRQLQLERRTPGLSLWFGIALIVVGVLVFLLSSWHHARLVEQLKRGGPASSPSSTQAISIALFLAFIGIVMAIYLVSVRAFAPADTEKKQEISMTLKDSKGIIDKPSNHSVDETVARIRNILQSKGVTLFALVDHSGEANKVGMKMLPTKLLIFGNPKAGTPLMLAAPSVAIDLPLKILVWEDGQGKVWVSYNSPDYLKTRHGLPQELLANIAVVETFATQAAE